MVMSGNDHRYHFMINLHESMGPGQRSNSRPLDLQSDKLPTFIMVTVNMYHNKIEIDSTKLTVSSATKVDEDMASIKDGHISLKLSVCTSTTGTCSNVAIYGISASFFISEIYLLNPCHTDGLSHTF